MATLQETTEKIKSTLSPLYTVILLAVVATIFFALGRLSALEERHTPIQIKNTAQTGAVVQSEGLQAPVKAETEQQKAPNSTVITPVETTHNGEVIGVRTSKKYYFPWCGVLKRVKPENKIPFLSADLARTAGYIPGGGCKGLQ